MYRIRNTETDELMDCPEFETLDDWENYLDSIAEVWDVVDDSEEFTSYEVSFNGETIMYLTAAVEE